MNLRNLFALEPKREPITDSVPVLDETALPQRFDKSETLTNGRHAEGLLSDPMLNAVFEAVADRYRKSWENSPRGDVEQQRIAHLSLAALKDVQGAIRAYLGNAKLLEASLAEQKKRDAQKYE